MRPRLPVIALAIAYPLLVLAGVATGASALRFAGLVALVLAVVLPGLLAGRRYSWVVAAVMLTGCAWLGRTGSSLLALLIAPIVIPAGVAWVFGRTLLRGQVPLIEQLVLRLHAGGPPADQERLRYARHLTVGWTTLLAALASANAILGALVAPGGFCDLLGRVPPVSVSVRAWALLTGIVGYALVIVFFVAEYMYRQQRFPVQPYDGFVDFLRRALASAPLVVAGHAGPTDTRMAEPDS